MNDPMWDAVFALWQDARVNARLAKEYGKSANECYFSGKAYGICEIVAMQEGLTIAAVIDILSAKVKL